MPDTCIAFKEWGAVCAALGSGRQSIILRKGGIHEGRAGFRFEHDAFALFPTRFHEQEQQVRDGGLPPDWPGPQPEYEVGDPVTIEFWATLHGVWAVLEWGRVAALEPMHVWEESTVRERFEWAASGGDPPALNVALVRVWRLAQPWEFRYQRGHGGCRSWVEVPAGATDDAEPVLSDELFEKQRELIERALEASD